jgi:hypothetical protein
MYPGGGWACQAMNPHTLSSSLPVSSHTPSLFSLCTLVSMVSHIAMRGSITARVVYMHTAMPMHGAVNTNHVTPCQA